jgi:hypothetical protein
MRLIPFEVSFEGRADKTLDQTLLGEAKGILAWAVRGCLDWLREGLSEPQRAREELESYRRESAGGAAEFLDGHAVFDPDARVPRKDLRLAFEEWCSERGHRPVGPRRFAETLRRMGSRHSVEVRGVNVRVGHAFADGWRGVRLASQSERAVWGDSGPEGSLRGDFLKGTTGDFLVGPGKKSPLKVPTSPQKTSPSSPETGQSTPNEQSSSQKKPLHDLTTQDGRDAELARLAELEEEWKGTRH